jgi:membrane-associated phospholipid phosphatase
MQVPISAHIDDWGRWFLRSYFVSSISCLCAYTLITFVADVPGPRWLAVLNAALFVPLAFILASLAKRLRALRRGERAVVPIDPDPPPGPLGHLSQMRWLIATVLMFGAWPGVYFLANQLAGLRDPVQFHFAIDSLIPLRTEFAPVYGTIYWFFILPLLYARDPALFRPLLYAYASILAICSTFFILYPVEYPRDPVVVRHFGDWTLALIHRADPPTNCFPSSHCAVAVLSALATRKVHPPAGTPALLLALAICAGTVFTRQHYLVDTVAGIALGTGSFLYFVEPELVARLRRNRTART